MNSQYQQLMQQQQHFDLFMSRFNNTHNNQANSANTSYNTPGNYSSTVSNAMSAVAAACKQQSSSSSASSSASTGDNTLVLPESITFKTPKMLAEAKFFKERQSKVQLQQQQGLAFFARLLLFDKFTDIIHNRFR